MLNPNDLDKFLTLEEIPKININDLVSEARKSLKRAILQARVNEIGAKIELTTTKTRFGGERYWFVCPSCRKTCGVLYSEEQKFSCRLCLGRLYQHQKYRE